MVQLPLEPVDILVQTVPDDLVDVRVIQFRAKPAELPMERPSKFDLIINLKTAQTLGLVIPQSVLAQATELIQ